MDRAILDRLLHIIASYTGKASTQLDMDLMAKPVSLLPHEMAALFLDVEREFSVDLNKLIPDLALFSPNMIAERIQELAQA